MSMTVTRGLPIVALVAICAGAALLATPSQAISKAVDMDGTATASGPASKPASAPSTQAAIDPQKATLAEALESWISLLEAGQQDQAAKLWASNAPVASQMSDLWKITLAAHKKYDYRKWSPKVKGDEVKFKVGGHEFGHLHILWIKTESGWRIQAFLQCN
jgi:hypothetical protein